MFVKVFLKFEGGVEYEFACFGISLIMAIVLGKTFMILGKLPFIGLFILMVFDFSSMSIQRSFTASAVLSASFNTCRNVAVFFPQPAMSWSISLL